MVDSASVCLFQAAKNNIDEHFVFVGLLEELDASLKVVEKLLPDYYSGISREKVG